MYVGTYLQDKSLQWSKQSASIVDKWNVLWCSSAYVLSGLLFISILSWLSYQPLKQGHQPWCHMHGIWNQCCDAGSWAWFHIYSMQTQIAQSYWLAFCPALLRPAPVLKGCLPGPMDCLLESVGSMKHSRALLHSITWCIMLTALMRCLFKGRWDTQLSLEIHVLPKAAAVHICVACLAEAAEKNMLAILGKCIASCLSFVFLASLHHTYVVDTNILCLSNCHQACLLLLDWQTV